MEIIKCSRISNFNNSTRTYYDAHDVRISDVFLPYNVGSKDLYHTHKEITEVLFILEGRVLVKILKNADTKEYIINKNKVIIFSPGEKHCVKPIGDNARVIVFKYLKTEKELLSLFISDWE